MTGAAGKTRKRYFDEESVRAVLEWDPLIDAMEAALWDFSSGKVLQPLRTMLTVEEGQRYLGVMPAVAEDAMGLKLVSFYPANAEKGVPTHHAMIVLMRPDTGEPLAAMDGTLITEMRTAAVSAAVTRRLARQRRPRSGAHRQRRAGRRPSRRAEPSADFRRCASLE